MLAKKLYKQSHDSRVSYDYVRPKRLLLRNKNKATGSKTGLNTPTPSIKKFMLKRKPRNGLLPSHIHPISFRLVQEEQTGGGGHDKSHGGAEGTSSAIGVGDLRGLNRVVVVGLGGLIWDKS